MVAFASATRPSFPSIKELSIRDPIKYVISLPFHIVNHTPPPPRATRVFAHVVSPGGGAFTILSQPGDWALAYPGATSEHLTDIHLTKDGRVYREGLGLCQRLACPSGTRKTCQCF